MLWKEKRKSDVAISFSKIKQGYLHIRVRFSKTNSGTASQLISLGSFSASKLQRDAIYTLVTGTQACL